MSGLSTKTTPSTPSRDHPTATVTDSSFHTAPMHSRRGARTTHRGRIVNTTLLGNAQEDCPLTSQDAFCIGPVGEPLPGKLVLVAQLQRVHAARHDPQLFRAHQRQGTGQRAIHVRCRGHRQLDLCTCLLLPSESDHQRLTHSAVYSSNRMRRRVTVCPRHHHRYAAGGWRSCRLQQPQSFSRLAHCCRRR